MSIKNKNVENIKQDLNKEHANHTKGKWYAEEMSATGLAVADKIKQSLDSTKKNLDTIASTEQKDIYNKKRSALQIDIEKYTKNLGTRDYIRRHSAIINDLAHKIDNTENAAINIIKQIQTKAETKQQLDTINKKEWGKNYFNEGKDGSITLTNAVNKPKIHEVLWDELIKTWQTRKIDYSTCRNQSIKTRMEAAIWWSSCYLIKGKDKQWNDTFVLQSRENGTMTILDQRALIREWVKLTPPWSYTLDDTHKEKVSFKKANYEALFSDLETTQPKFAKKIDTLERWRNNFFELTEKKLNERVKYAKEHGRDLQTKPVSKHTFWIGTMMELHFINGSAKVDKVFMRKDKDFDGDMNLYDMMDRNESELLTYLTKRIQAKRSETKKFEKKEIIKQETTDEMSRELLEQVNHGLWLLEKLSDGLIQKEGNAVIFSWDKYIRSFKQAVTNLQHTLAETWELNIEETIQLLTKRYVSYIQDLPENKIYATVIAKYKLLFADVIQWNKVKAHAALRKLANATEIIGDSSSAWFLRDEIINTEYEQWDQKHENIEIENTIYDRHLKNIKKKFELTGNESKDKIIKQNIDALYEQKGKGQQWILNVLIAQDILPQWTKLDTDEKLWWKISKWPIRKLCMEMQEFLKEQTKAEEQFVWENYKDITAKYRQELATLQQKTVASDSDLARMQEIELLLLPENQETLEALIEIWNEATKEQIKYQGIAWVLWNNLTKRLAEKWWGFRWTNADILNDSYGLRGRWDFSDENVAMTRAWAKMLAEEMVFMAITAALIASGIWAGAGAALATTRIWKRWARWAKAFTKLKNSKKVQKLWKLLDKNKITRVWKEWAKTMIQAAPWAVTRWSIHQILSTTYRGEWDNNFKTHTVELLKKIGMYSILWAIGKLRMSNRYQQLFESWWSKTLKESWYIWTILMEELGIEGAHRLTNTAFGLKMTEEEIIEGLIYWLAFEWLWLFWRYWKSAKFTIMQGGKWQVKDGNKTTNLDPKVEIDKAFKENVKANIEQQFSRYNRNSDQLKLNNFNKWYEKQSKYELQILQAQELLRSINDINLTGELRVLRDAWDIVTLSPNDIKRVQWIIWAKADTIRWDKSLNKLASYLDSKLSGVKNHINTPLPISKESSNIKSQMERSTKQSNYAWELLSAMDMLWKIEDNWLPDAMKKLKNADQNNPVRKNDIIALQKELWITGRDIDGVLWPKTLKKLETHLHNMNVNKITKEDFLITKGLLREDAIKNWIGDKKAFYTEAKANGWKLTIDGVEYMVRQWRDRIEIATAWVWWWKKPLSDLQKSDLFRKYQEQKVQEFINNHPDIKYAKIIDDAVVNNNKAKVKQSISIAEKQLTEITIEGVNIPPAVATYFKNNPISESVAKKLTPEDIRSIDDFLTSDAYKNGAIVKWNIVWKNPEEVVKRFLDDAVAKRVEAPARVEAKAWDVVKVVESSWSKKPFDLAKSADDIAAQAFKEVPANTTLAKSRVKEFGIRLWKNAIWPSMKFIADAVTWLRSIEIKFPSLKDQIAKISKTLESMRIDRSIKKINAMQWKNAQEKINFLEKFDIDNASNGELIALYKMTWWQWDPLDWAVVTLKDWTNTLQTRLKSEINDNINTLRKMIPKAQTAPKNAIEQQHREITDPKDIDIYLNLAGYGQYDYSKTGKLNRFKRELVYEVEQSPIASKIDRGKRFDGSSNTVMYNKDPYGNNVFTIMVYDAFGRSTSQSLFFRLEGLSKNPQKIQEIKEITAAYFIKNFDPEFSQGGHYQVAFWKKSELTDPKVILEFENKIKKALSNTEVKHTKIERINHDFRKSPEVKLLNQEIVIQPKKWELFEMSLGNTNYKLYQNNAWTMMYVIPWNPPKQVALTIWKEYKIWRDHLELTGEIKDQKISRNHMSIKVDKDGNISIKDLNSTNKTHLRKVHNKENISSWLEISIQKNRIEWFNKVKLSEISKDFVKNFGQPKHSIDINWNKLYVTDALMYHWRKFLVWYSNTGELRMFYRSWSEAEWRSCPWLRIVYSKLEIDWYSYETTTKIESRINTFFDTLETKTISKDPIEYSYEYSYKRDGKWYNRRV